MHASLLMNGYPFGLMKGALRLSDEEDELFLFVLDQWSDIQKLTHFAVEKRCARKVGITIFFL